jgi:magnesium-transporting ATPase (P-type)
MAGGAMRVLALADRSLPQTYTQDDLTNGFTFLGLIGLVDPIRETAPAAIAALHRAGIRTVMITGDHALTATAVARTLGLDRGGPLHVLEAGDLQTLQPDALRGLVHDVTVFARVPPEMRLAIVRALQARGEVVAMTGVGVNDGPALRAADVGVAMGQHGTELARELADVVLSTDDFLQMVDAVEEGRLEPGLMQRQPRDPSESILPRSQLRRVLLESLAIAGSVLGVYGIGLRRLGPGPAAQTMAFASLVAAQIMHARVARHGQDASAWRGLLACFFRSRPSRRGG